MKNSKKEISSNQLIIRKLVLGPFKSNLNPIGLMNPSFVARNIVFQANIGLNLIIVTPNPWSNGVSLHNEPAATLRMTISKGITSTLWASSQQSPLFSSLRP